MFKLVFCDIKKNFKLFFGTFFSILVASSIITTCLTLIFSANDSFSKGHRFSNVDFVLTPNNKIKYEIFDDDLKIESEFISGVATFSDLQISELKKQYDIIEDYTFYITSDIISNKLAGHNISSIDLTGFDLIGKKPNTEEIVIDEDLALENSFNIGDKILIKTNFYEYEYTISGIVYSIGNENYEIQNYIFFNDEIAKENAVGVRAVAILNESVDINSFKNDEYNVFVKDKVDEAELSSMISNDISLMVIFITMGSVCLVISLFVISGTMQFSIKNRFRMITQLRIIGMKKGQVKFFLSLQTIIISLFSSFLGALLSIPLSKFIISLYLDMGIVSYDFLITFNIIWGIIVMLVISILSIFVTHITANKPLKIPPASAIKNEGENIGKTTFGVLTVGIVLVLGGVAILLFTPMTQGVGIGMVFCSSTVLLGGFICLSSILVKVFNIIFSIITKNFSKNLGKVAYANINYKASKFAVASISIAIMMSMGGAMVLSNEVFIKSSMMENYEFASDYKYVSNDKFQYEIEGSDLFAIKNTRFLVPLNNNLNDYNVLAVIGDIPNINIIESNSKIINNYIYVSDSIKNVKLGSKVEVFLENGEVLDFFIGGIFKQKGITDENYSIIVDYNYIKNSLYNKQLTRIYSNEKIFFDSKDNDIQFYENSISYDIQNAASLLLGTIAFVLSIVALFNTFFLIMSVRKEEFNKLKLVGAKKSQIFGMATIEVVIVVLTGMIIGMIVLISCVGTYSKANIGIFEYVVNPVIFYGIISATGILGLIAGFLPSILTVYSLRKTFRNE